MSEPTPAPAVYRRSARADARALRRTISAPTAAAAIGPLTPGCEIYGLTKGQFSLIDILDHCLDTAGPSAVTISTWTAAGADLTFAHRMLTDGRITAMRFIVDFSFPTRQPAYCAALRERFGDAAIRITKTHAKFVLVERDPWHFVIRSSMNLNENRRLESFEISDDAGMAAYLHDVCRELFETHAPGRQFENTPYANCVDFERLGESTPIDATTADERARAGSRFFNDQPLGTDLRRAGFTYTKTGKPV